MAYLNGVDDVYVNGENGRQRIQYRIALDANGNPPQFVDIGGTRYAVRTSIRKKKSIFGKLVGGIKSVAKIGVGVASKGLLGDATILSLPARNFRQVESAGMLGASAMEQLQADRRNGFSNRALLMKYRGRI